MATKMSMAILFVVLTAVVHVTEAATYEVGDTTGWTTPSPTTFYATWAEKYNFTVGDTLVFNFTTGVHDVATVTKTAYDACTTTNYLSINSTGPVTLTLSSGEHYFICTIPTHCSSGQKLAINVTGSSSSPTTPGAVSPPPPPPPSSSASSLAATFPLVLITIALTSFIKF